MTTHAHSVSVSTLWPTLRNAAETLKNKEPALAAFVQNSILSESDILGALARLLSAKLATADVPAPTLHAVFMEAYKAAPQLADIASCDIVCSRENDPAARDVLTPFLFFKGYHALQAYRVAHWFWGQERHAMALFLQSRISDVFGVDIHPAAVIGRGVMMDHATGIVIGETATVGDNVLFWHGVTLGGKGTAGGDRHPKIGNDVQLGAGSTVLGNTKVGAGVKIAAGSVVVSDVEPGVTVAGIPAKPIGK